MLLRQIILSKLVVVAIDYDLQKITFLNRNCMTKAQNIKPYDGMELALRHGTCLMRGASTTMHDDLFIFISFRNRYFKTSIHNRGSKFGVYSDKLRIVIFFIHNLGDGSLSQSCTK